MKTLSPLHGARATVLAAALTVLALGASSGAASAQSAGAPAGSPAPPVAAPAAAPAAPAAPTAKAQPAPRLSYSNKWRIEVSEGANSSGALVFRLTPRDGTAQEVRIPIADGTSENRVARRLRDGFRRQLDGKTYEVEVDDGEDVLLKKRLGKPDFALELVSFDVKSVRINLDKE
ncbi:MAG: hypothetical protein MUF07_09615 [Steroidobacteraceae bacterium]|jgi:hypothetical protein|nr:hypothetical protein [Steroidobacteraceae bacterium]